jgi:arylformamidase
LTRYVDLSHPLHNGMDPYPGLPAPRFEPILDHDASRSRYDDQAEFYLGRAELSGNTGTYIDSPFHRFKAGKDLAGIPLARCAGLDGYVIRARVEDRVIDLGKRSIPPGAAILIETGWSSRWGSPAYWELGPFIGEAALARLLALRPSLVGVDCWNVDDTEDPSRRVHTALLKQEVLIVEHMTGLNELPDEGFRFYAVPLGIEGGASFPVRAFAEL